MNKTLKKIIIVIIIVVVLVLLGWFLFKDDDVSKYIKQGNLALEALNTSGLSLVEYANEYVNTRTGLETSVKESVDNANISLDEIRRYQQMSVTDNSTVESNLTLAITTAQNASNNANSSNTALINIQNLMVNTSVSTDPGTQFGNALVDIENQKKGIENIYANTKVQIQELTEAVEKSKISEQNISDYLVKSNASLEQLNSYINSLLGNIKNSDEYLRLQVVFENAKNIYQKLSNINSTLPETSVYKTTIINLIYNLDQAVKLSDKYLSNILNVFILATNNANTNLVNYINQLNNILVTGASIVGTVPNNITTPAPIPTLTSAPFSIVYYFNNANAKTASIVQQYNNIIVSYNQIIANLNTIQDLSTNMLQNIYSTINNVNTNLLTAEGIMKNYFPGSTTPGVLPNITMPPSSTYSPTLTTMSPYTYTSL